MPYAPISYSSITNRELAKIIRHSDHLLRDLYEIFKNQATAGAGNFTITLVLLCIIDGISVYLYPTRKIVKQQNRFKKLIRDKLPWGPPGNGWLPIDIAAKQFYLELRNPLVHELGADAPGARRPGQGEALIGKWGSIPTAFSDIEYIQSLSTWNVDWPILQYVKDTNGHDCLKLSGAALWWAVKKMIQDLVDDPTVCQAAVSQFVSKPAPLGFWSGLLRRLRIK